MSQAERISRIHYLLRSKGQFTTKQIQDEFEVARNTVMSDVTLMRDRLRAPIVFDPKKAAYVYDKGRDDPWDYHDSFDLPGFWVSRAEAYGMLTLLNLSSQLDPGLLYPSVYPLRGVLKKLLVTRMTMRGYHKKVVVDLPNLHVGEKGIASDLSKALLGGSMVLAQLDSEDEPILRSLQRFVLKPTGWWVEYVDGEDDTLKGAHMNQFTHCEIMAGRRAKVLPQFQTNLDEDLEALRSLYFGR